MSDVHTAPCVFGADEQRDVEVDVPRWVRLAPWGTIVLIATAIFALATIGARARQGLAHAEGEGP
ncbi:MAG: hypothetical protein K6U88_09600 [Dehalococcoidia bacterium]|nr:hypothetical protein [Dehalococcoidia bacterium]